MLPRRRAVGTILVLTAVVVFLLGPATILVRTGAGTTLPASGSPQRGLDARRTSSQSVQRSRQAKESHEAEDDDGPAEQAGHGDEEERSEKGKHEDEDLVFTIATLVALFIMSTVGLLYLVNWPDPNVRSYIYKMLSSTMSIFLAVTINMALSSILECAIGLRDGVDTTYGMLAAGILIFAGSWISTDFTVFFFREHQVRVYATRVIGGHITGFAGITVFGILQMEAGKSGHHLTVLCCAPILCSLTFVSRHIIVRKFGPYKPTQTYVTLAEEDESEDQVANRKWRLAVCEAEDDALALIISFLGSQVVLWLVTGRFEKVHGEHSNPERLSSSILSLLYIVLAGACVLMLSTYYRKSLRPVKALDGSDPTGCFIRSVIGFQSFMAKSLSWLCLRIGAWQMYDSLKDTKVGSHAMAEVMNAFATTCICIIAVVLLDCVADNIGNKIEAAAPQKARSQAATSNGSSPVRSHTSRVLGKSNNTRTMALSHMSSSADLCALDDVDIKVQDLLNGHAVLGLLAEHVSALQSQSMDASNLEKAIRTIIQAFGLLVGLCWEKATDAAIITIIDDCKTLHDHPTLARVAAALIVILIMFPAWVKYIMPEANKHWTEHQTVIRMEEMHRGSRQEADSSLLVLELCSRMRDEDIFQSFHTLLEERPHLKSLVGSYVQMVDFPE